MITRIIAGRGRARTFGYGLLVFGALALGGVGPAAAGSLEDMISPVSVPTINEDPRVTTELRPMYLHTGISDDFVTQGGHYEVIALQARAAITERFGLIASKDGYVWLRPDAGVPDADGWANLALGLKGVLWKSEEDAGIVTAGLRYEIPSGGTRVFQDRGYGFMNPFVSAAKGFGNFHTQLYTGPRVALDGADSSFWDLSLHFDYKIDKFYPLMEFNWIHTLDGGSRIPISQEGFDLVNFGASKAGGTGTAALAFGLRYRILEDLDFGATGEFAAGRADLFGWRVTTDFIWRPFGWGSFF